MKIWNTFPVNTIYWIIAGSMLAHRLRRWPSIEAAMGEAFYCFWAALSELSCNKLLQADYCIDRPYNGNINDEWNEAIIKQMGHYGEVHRRSTMLYGAKTQYMLTCKVSRHCISALRGKTDTKLLDVVNNWWQYEHARYDEVHLGLRCAGWR